MFIRVLLALYVYEIFEIFCPVRLFTTVPQYETLEYCHLVFFTLMRTMKILTIWPYHNYQKSEQFHSRFLIKNMTID